MQVYTTIPIMVPTDVIITELARSPRIAIERYPTSRDFEKHLLIVKTRRWEVVKGRRLFLFFSFLFSFPRAISHIYARFRVNKKDKHERRISRVRVIFTSGGERLRREARRGGRRGAGFRSRPEYRIVSGALMKSLSHDAAGGGTFYYYLIASRY